MGESDGVEGCADFDVVVEVEEDVAGFAFFWGLGGGVLCGGNFGAAGPGVYSGGPLVECGGRIAAGVEGFVTVEAGVDEVGGEVFEEGPFAGGVGDDKGDVVLAEERDEVGGVEGLVADFHGVAEGAIAGGFEKRAALHEGGVFFGEGGGFFGVAREQFEKIFEAIGLKCEDGGELPQNGSELFLECEEALGEEVGEGFFDIVEACACG